MRSYIYDKTLYLFDVVITGSISLLALIAFIILAFFNIYPLLMLVFSLVAFYSFWNSFIARVHPKQILLDGDQLSFISFGREEKFVLGTLKSFRIREFPSAAKIYLRINDRRAIEKRYWINARNYNDGKELFMTLLDMEYRKHPNTLKARARRTNTAYLQAEKKEKGCS